jgi:hypothetical protein
MLELTAVALSFTSPRPAGRGRIASAMRVRGSSRELDVKRGPSPQPSPRKNGERELFPSESSLKEAVMQLKDQAAIVTMAPR